MFTAYLSKYMFAKLCKHNKKDAVELLFRTSVRYHTSDHLFADKFPEDNSDFDNEMPDDNDLEIINCIYMLQFKFHFFIFIL